MKLRFSKGELFLSGGEFYFQQGLKSFPLRNMSHPIAVSLHIKDAWNVVHKSKWPNLLLLQLQVCAMSHFMGRFEDKLVGKFLTGKNGWVFSSFTGPMPARPREWNPKCWQPDQIPLHKIWKEFLKFLHEEDLKDAKEFEKSIRPMLHLSEGVGGKIEEK